jgi:alanine racemase
LHHVSAPSIRVLHGPITPADAAFMQQTGIMPVINSVAQAKLWIEAGGAACDLMVDTGINRLGIRADDLSDPALRALQVDFLHSHLACADEDSSRNADQLRLFCEVSGQIAHKRRALANSAGIMLGADYHFDATRPGLSLYGGRPRDGMDQIAQVAFPQAAILQRKQVREGEAVGYNATFTAPRDMIIAVISIGYADGYLRCWSGKGEVMANGSRLPVLGRVSMDMICVDITQAPDLREGDWVDLPWDLPDTAHRSGLSQYELLTTLGHRFDRTNRMK